MIRSGLAARQAPQVADNRVEAPMRKIDLDGLVAVEPLEGGPDDLPQLLFVGKGQLESLRVRLDDVGQVVVAVDHHDGDARLMEAVHQVAQDAQGLSAPQVLAQIERDAQRPRLGPRQAAQARRRGIRVGDARAAVEQAIPHALRDGPDPHIAFEPGRGLADDLQGIPLLVGDDGDAVGAALDELSELLEIVHRFASVGADFAPCVYCFGPISSMILPSGSFTRIR